ncbi:MAG: hypothetical protein LLG13_06610 [Bacteroidales bacterium]|nr:hypothetical protein [Bacteroidales bacterium]
MVGLTFLDKDISFQTYPYLQGNDKAWIRPLDGLQKRCFEENLIKLNQIIVNPDLLLEEYKKQLAKISDGYKIFFEPYSYKNKYINYLYNKHLLPSFLSKSKRLVLLNLIRCETHYDKMIYLLKNFK